MAGTFGWRLGELSCHVGATDYRVATDHREPGRGWADGQLAQLATEVTRPRRCPYFIPFEPGNSPEKHLELERAAQKTRSDRTGDIVKIGIGFVLGVAATPLSGNTKALYDQLRALAP